MGHNRAGENRKKRLRRRKKLEQRLAVKKKAADEEKVASVFVKNSYGKLIYLKYKDFDTVEWGLPEPMTFSAGVAFLSGFFNRANTVETCDHRDNYDDLPLLWPDDDEDEDST